MIAEIAEMEGSKPNNVARIIKMHPEIIREMKRIWVEMELISSFGLIVLNASTYPEFVRLSREYMLTATDAAHLATMERFGIVSMASNDIDFQRVRWLKLWQPEKLN
jgi:predicted nucleic acid-binding protein